jgi:hypothetical protein
MNGVGSHPYSPVACRRWRRNASAGARLLIGAPRWLTAVCRETPQGFSIYTVALRSEVLPAAKNVFHPLT